LRGAGLTPSVPRRSLPALVCALALTFGGCGSGRTATPAATQLEREDFAAVCHALSGLTAAVGEEVATTKAAWPLITHGLPRSTGIGAPSAIVRAAARAARLRLPLLFGEVPAASLTGPSAHIAGLFRSYRGLAARGWQMIAASIAQIEHGPPVGARFARANVALYIESVYDGHFTLAQVGKQLIAGYEKLGGAAAFGASLTQAEVDALARTYSEASDRLHPHVGVRLGS
jgi:hypothetical protein